MVDLANKISIVTGGAQGIGKAIVRRLHAAGSFVIVVDTALELLNDLEAELGRGVFTCVADVSNGMELKTALAPVITSRGPVTILVNNAAAVTRRAKLIDLTL